MSNWHEKGELPPVGEIVEYDSKWGWIETKVLAHHPDKATVWHEFIEEQDNQAYSTDGCRYFRPIKSEQDKLVARLIKDSVTMNCGYECKIPKHLAQTLIEAGWRLSND